MLNNIEQAITNVLTDNQTPDYYNVADAYIRLIGGPFPGKSAASIETAYSFERALDKYPSVGEKIASQAPFAEMIADFRKTHWELNIEITAELMGDDYFPCPCCGIYSNIDEIRRKLGLLDDVEVEAPSKKPKKKPRRRINQKKKSKKSKGKILAFDPYGPSTSASSM